MANPEQEGHIVNMGNVVVPIDISVGTHLVLDDQHNVTDERSAEVMFTMHPLAVESRLSVSVKSEGSIAKVGNEFEGLQGKDAETIVLDHLDEAFFVSEAEAARDALDAHDRGALIGTAIGATAIGVTAVTGVSAIVEAIVTNQQSAELQWKAGSALLSGLLTSVMVPAVAAERIVHRRLVNALENAQEKSMLARLLAGGIRGRNVTKDAVEAEVAAAQQSPTQE